jgi:hypothetical protein
MFKLPNFTSYAAIGISNIAKQIYQASRLRTGVLNQYYILREQNIPYKIALAPINNGSIVSASVNRIKKINIDKGVFIKAFYRPYKSVAYLINRYKLHPVYKYEFWNVNEQCLLVVRKICVENRSVIRIVDCLGSLNDMPDLYADFQLMLREEDAEYIDFMNYGINEEVFAKMGFQKLDHDGDVIIPNYFEPFERRNVKIEFAYKADFDYVIFKGDSDQDRPNIL